MITDWKNEDAQHFEAHAIEALQPLYQWFVKDIEQITGNSVRDRNILDIGCGPGFMLKALSDAGAAMITGVDLSLAMLQTAAKSGRADNAMLIQADVTRLPLKAAQFDFVFSRGSIFFWQELERSLRQIATCLKPMGTAILGGGYGLSSPQELVDAARRNHSGNSASTIPKIDLDQLLACARSQGGSAEIKAAPRRGFWLAWQPQQPSIFV